jgi:hypothetical protein
LIRRRTAVVAIAASLAAIMATSWLLAHSRGADIATVLMLPVAVLALLVAIRSRPHADDHQVLVASARALSAQVAERVAAVLQRLLVDTGEAHPANVRYVQLPGTPQGRSAGDEVLQGSIETIAADFLALERRRIATTPLPPPGTSSAYTHTNRVTIRKIPSAPSAKCSAGVPSYGDLVAASIGASAAVRTTPDALSVISVNAVPPAKSNRPARMPGIVPGSTDDQLGPTWSCLDRIQAPSLRRWPALYLRGAPASARSSDG